MRWASEILAILWDSRDCETLTFFSRSHRLGRSAFLGLPGKNLRCEALLNPAITHSTIGLNHESELNKTMTITTTNTARINNLYEIRSRFGIESRTPWALNMADTRPGPKGTWMPK
jgi:hypothetical protein